MVINFCFLKQLKQSDGGKETLGSVFHAKLAKSVEKRALNP